MPPKKNWISGPVVEDSIAKIAGVLVHPDADRLPMRSEPDLDKRAAEIKLNRLQAKAEGRERLPRNIASEPGMQRDYQPPSATADEKFNETAAAQYIFGPGGSERTLQGWRSRGFGPRFLKLGRRIVYRRRELDAWLAGRERASTSDRGEAA
jgi:hypothetical protein